MLAIVKALFAVMTAIASLARPLMMHDDNEHARSIDAARAVRQGVTPCMCYVIFVAKRFETDLHISSAFREPMREHGSAPIHRNLSHPSMMNVDCWCAVGVIAKPSLTGVERRDMSSLCSSLPLHPASMRQRFPNDGVVDSRVLIEGRELRGLCCFPSERSGNSIYRSFNHAR